MNRCPWLPLDKPDYVDYHDTQWGIPVHNDQLLFEMLSLEGAQAGLSWYTILKRRKAYQKAFKNFNILKVSKMSDLELEDILANSQVIRNRLKVYSVRKNALVVLAIIKEFGSFDKYLWAYVDYKPIINHPKNMKAVPTCSAISDALSKDLKKRGMSFVGSTIMYAYMQAIGMVDDHTVDCFKSN